MSEKNKDGLFSCPNICWMIAVVLGFAAFMMALSKFHHGAIFSMIIGIVVFFVFGWLLGKIFCSASEGTAVADPVGSAKAAAPAKAETAVTSAAAPEKAATAPVAQTGATPAAVATAAVVSEPKVAAAPEAPKAAKKPASAAKKADAAKKPAAAKKAEKKPAAKKAEATKADVKKADAKKAEKKPAVKTASAPVAAPAAEAGSEAKPRTMKAPRKAGADDLKLLKGVGPKLEQTLNELGFYHFDQVAKWSEQEIAWVDSRLRFKGRIERDGWIDQAKILADGGETEFSARGKKA